MVRVCAFAQDMVGLQGALGAPKVLLQQQQQLLLLRGSEMCSKKRPSTDEFKL